MEDVRGSAPRQGEARGRDTEGGRVSCMVESATCSAGEVPCFTFVVATTVISNRIFIP